jgi:hypothetical protein
VWSDADTGFTVVDLKTHERRKTNAPDSTIGMYGPVLSPDGSELLAARWQPPGFYNDLWRIRLDGGAWTAVRYDMPGDPSPIQWDPSGVYAQIEQLLGTERLSQRVWRANRPGDAFIPFLTGAGLCANSVDLAISLSRDRTRGACTESRATPDIWLVTDFDP